MEPTAVQRVVLLGASNLTLSFPIVLHTLPELAGGPVEVFAAHGHGRSYGMASRVLWRTLPGIEGLPLWRMLEQRPANGRRPWALITDVGNDLVYGASVEQILAWVNGCLDRLTAHNADITLTLLPIPSLERLSAWRYEMTRRVFFPGRRFGREEMLSRARQLNVQLRELGRRYGAHLVDPPGEWYGFDPIHVRFRLRRRAWRQILSQWEGCCPGDACRDPSLVEALRVWCLRPAQRSWAGVVQVAQQPCLQKPDGTSLWLY